MKEWKSKNLSFHIHHWVGCGDDWFLTCYKLGIDKRPLLSKKSDNAGKEAIEIIRKELEKLNEAFKEITGIAEYCPNCQSYKNCDSEYREDSGYCDEYR